MTKYNWIWLFIGAVIASIFWNVTLYKVSMNGDTPSNTMNVTENVTENTQSPNASAVVNAAE